jgi:GntR family transcriptional regulator, carbon starvation induced regulator
MARMATASGRMTDQRGGGSVKVREPVGESVRDAIKPDTLIEKAYAALKNDIIRGRHRPLEKLRVEHLKRDYGVSGSTMREALTMLIADRLVIFEGQRGFRVKPVSAEELIDLNRIRILLEKEAIRQSIAHGDDEWEASVVSSFHMLGLATKAFAANMEDEAILEEWERRHRAFHLSLIAAAPSEWLRHLVTLSYQQYERYRHLFLAVAQEFYKERDAEAEHVAIVEAVLGRDADTAARLIEEHVTRSIDEWVGYFKKVGAFKSSAAADGDKKAGANGRKVKT